MTGVLESNCYGLALLRGLMDARVKPGHDALRMDALLM
jgi:hypothetical protein